jgi:hypothetical protein
VNQRSNDPVNESADVPADDGDWWASRLIDGEIAFADVPADLRGLVHDRAEVFNVQRRALLRLDGDHRVDSALTERAVATAMLRPESNDVPRRRRLAPLLAVAAVSVGVIAVGASVLRRDDSPDLIAVDAPAVPAESNAAPAIEESPKAAPGSVDIEPTIDDGAAAMSVDTAPLLAPEAAADTTRREAMPDEITEVADMIELAALADRWRVSPPALLDGPAACEDDEGRPAVAVNVRFAGIDAQAYYSPEAGVMLLAVADCLKLASIVP